MRSIIENVQWFMAGNFFFFWCLGSVRELLSKVMELRASNWGSGTSEGDVGNYPVYPSDDGYYYSDYPLGMVSSL